MPYPEFDCFIVEAPPSFVLTSDHQLGNAYDLSKDISRYHELTTTYSDEQARQILLNEMTEDLTTHFGELNRIGAFSYRYLIRDNQLVEDSPAAKLVTKMFDGQNGVIAKLWQENIIPTLEMMPVGSTVFTYSSRQDGQFENGYDFAYVFQKIDNSTIHATGVELVLTRYEQASVLNNIYQQKNLSHLLLTNNPEPDDVRGRAFWFPPDDFSSTAEVYAKLIGQVIKPLRASWDLETISEYEHYLKINEINLQKQKIKSSHLAENLVAGIGKLSLSQLESKLISNRNQDLWRLYPQMMENAKNNGVGQIILPCGIIDLASGFDPGDLRYTSGFSLVESTTWTYHTGNCRHCHSINVEVGPCEICKNCEKIL